MIHFKENGLLYFYPTITRDITDLFIAEFRKLKNELQLPNINKLFDKLNEDIYNKSLSNSDDNLFIEPKQIEEKYIIYFNENNISKKYTLWIIRKIIIINIQY